VRTMAQDAFGRALSLGPMRDKPVADKELRKLAMDVLREERSGLAMDATDPLDEALDQLADFLRNLGVDARNRQQIFDLCRQAVVASGGQDAEQVGGAELLARSSETRGQPGKPENYFVARESERPDGQAADRRLLLAQDARGSELAALLAEYPNPGRLIAAR
jgi:hypothetical protein